jgi:hypothetical protein
MNLKQIVAISVVAALPAFGQTPTDRSSANPPKLTKADVQRVMQSIIGDKAKMQAYCDLSKLNQQMVQADEKTVQKLGLLADDLTHRLGPDYLTLMQGLDQADESSGEASFDEITAALVSLDDRCK